jgi:hypothetical protein
MSEPRSVLLAASKLVPDIDRFKCGSDAYDAPARRRDVLEALRVIEALRPRIQWREFLPSHGHGGEMRLDGGAIPFFVLHWVATISGSVILMSLAIKAWQWATT